MKWVIPTALAFAVTISVAPAQATEPPTPCLIEPHQTIKLAMPVAGVLAQVLVDRGDHVKRGAVLARLESGVESADLAAAKLRASDATAIATKEARRDLAESKLARMKSLRASTQYVAQSAADEAEADARQARAELQAAMTAYRLTQIDVEHAQARLDQRAIRSPVDGLVTERALKPGEYAYEQAPVLTIAELDPLNVEAYLPIAQYGRIRPGHPAEVRPEAPVGGQYAAAVSVIDAVVDQRSSTFGVRLTIPNAAGALPAGLRCTVTFAPGEAG